jgi:ABC-type thiamine transport system substrate-binding protein
MKRLKGGSSKSINDHELTVAGGSFGWQDGYGAFSVSKSNVPMVINYISSQREHHRTRSFKEEFLEFLEKHEVDYDPTYLWG